MTVKIVTNTTGAPISILEVGKDLAPAEVYNIAAVQYPHWAYATRAGSFLEARIIAGDITVSDGLTPILGAVLGAALLRDPLARNIAFDNRTNSFISTEVQSAIEEVATSSQGVDSPFDCDVSTSVGDIVVLSLTADNKVESLISNVYTSLAVGVVSLKPTSITCRVKSLGLQGGFSALTRGLPVFVSTLGVPTTSVPLTGHLQIIGVASSATTALINVALYKVQR